MPHLPGADLDRGVLVSRRACEMKAEPKRGDRGCPEPLPERHGGGAGVCEKGEPAARGALQEDPEPRQVPVGPAGRRLDLDGKAIPPDLHEKSTS